jgi:voltage-gated potassium channel
MIIIKVPKMVKATWKGVVLLVLLTVVSSLLFYFYETGRTVGESFYWAIITMTTVGYGDINPESDGAKIVSIGLSCVGILLYGYLGAMIMYIMMESSLSGVFGMNRCKYKDHFVIGGWTDLSEIVLLELLADNREVAVITEEQDDVPMIKRIEEKGNVFPIFGDPSKAEILDQANLKEAAVVVLAMEDDSKNLITTLNVREENPKARIIVKTSRAELKKTMKIAGVTYVVTPHVMAGRLIASAAFEPEVANFVEDVTSATDVGGHDLRQYTISQDRAGSIAELSRHLRQKTNATLVGIARKSAQKGARTEQWNVLPNPKDSEKVKPGDVVILLGNDEEFEKAEEFLGTKQGR